MADELDEVDTENDDDAEEADDRDYDTDEAFEEGFARTFGQTDQDALDAIDGMASESGEDGEEEEEDDAEEADDDEEHPAKGTSEDPDGDDSESDDDSTEVDDDEHPDDDDESPDSDDDDAADDEGEKKGAKADAESDVAALTKKLLETRGADLRLDDLPAAARPLVAKKLKGIDAAFTKVMQEVQQNRQQFQTEEADRRFRSENPIDVVVSILRKEDGTLDEALFQQINTRLDELDNPTIAAAHAITLRDKRAQLERVVADEYAAEQTGSERGIAVEQAAQRMAAAAGVPWGLAEVAVLGAIQAKPAGQRDITDEELAATIADIAKRYQATRKKDDRESSKKKVQDLSTRRSATKKLTPPSVKHGSTPVKVKPKKAIEVDPDDDEQVEAAMMRLARRLKPGRK